MTEGEMFSRIWKWMERDHLTRGAWRILAGGLFCLPLLAENKAFFVMLFLESAAACVWLPAWGLAIWAAGIATRLTLRP